MRAKAKTIIAAAVLCVVGGPASVGAEEKTEPVPRPVIVIFDLRSPGDDGELGRWVANNIRERTVRKGLYVVVEEMDLAAAVEAQEFAAEYGSPIQKVAEFARSSFGCDLAMWGRVDRAGDALVIRVKVAATGEQPDLVMNETFTAENRHMTQAAVKEMLRQLAGEEKPKEEYDPAWDEAWEKNPNLVKNPGFEEGEDHPAHWDRPNARDYHHNMVHWTDAPAAAGRGKCIKFEMDAGIAASYGVGYYSEPIDTSEGTRYRFSVRVLSKGPTVKIFLKHYAYFPPTGNEKKGQWRETRRAPLNCHGAGGEWKTFVRDFNPRRNDAYDPRTTKVGLYAYWPAGVVYFDDATLKRIE